MSLSAQDENAKTLARLLGLDDDEAAQLLNMTIVVRAASDALSQAIRRHIVDLLKRTVGRVTEDGTGDVEVAIGDIAPADSVRAVRIGVTPAEVTISCEVAPKHESEAGVPDILLLIGACYGAGMSVRLGLGRAFPLPHADTIRVPVDRFLRRGHDVVADPVQLGKVYVAGAGAIGNGLLQALGLLNVEGELHIVDPKNVTAGNLGRCLWFEEADIGRSKAEALVSRAQPSMPNVKLVPRVGRLQTLPERSAGRWLKRLVVAVDSRRARRRLQEELPGEVLDASTTGIEEVVVHFNEAKADGACLSCIYEEDRVEAAHEQHVAEMLGVDVADVREHFVGEDASRRMVERHPQLDASRLVGVAYDTLFKALCATGQLGVDEGRTVLAPFSFVSVLAGAFLALELVLRVAADDIVGSFNYWRASPWTSPVFELQALRTSRPTCETCGNALIGATVDRLWGFGGKKAS